MSWASSVLHRIRRAPYRRQNGGMTAASTNQSVEALSNLLVRRRRILVEQRFRSEDPAIQAVPALERLLFDEGLLHGMRFLHGPEPFQRDDPLSNGIGHRRHARSHRLLINQDGAGAAL